MEQPIESDNGDEMLSELDDLVTESEMLGKSTRERNKDTHKELDTFLDDLIAEAQRPKQLWITDSQVVLIYQRNCTTCGTVTEMCQGWFTSQHHATDPFAKRMIAGKPIGHWPVGIVREIAAPMDICSHCAEAQVEALRGTRHD